MILKAYIEPLAYDIAFWMQGVDDPAYPLASLGDLSLELSEKLRALGIIQLLVDGATDAFYHNLIRSGLCREKYLQRVIAENDVEDHHFAAGRYEPLLDAIAAADFECVARIAALEPTSWREGREYEDDYCYAKLLQGLLDDQRPGESLQPYIEQFEAYLEGNENSRLDICNALMQRDSVAFEAAFGTLLLQRSDRIEADMARGQLEEPHIIAQRLVYVEGLALLRIADKLGMATQQEYRYCPSLARLPMETPFPGGVV